MNHFVLKTQQIWFMSFFYDYFNKEKTHVLSFMHFQGKMVHLFFLFSSASVNFKFLFLYFMYFILHYFSKCLNEIASWMSEDLKTNFSLFLISNQFFCKQTKNLPNQFCILIYCKKSFIFWGSTVFITWTEAYKIIRYIENIVN